MSEVEQFERHVRVLVSRSRFARGTRPQIAQPVPALQDHKARQRELCTKFDLSDHEEVAQLRIAR